jgi:hypothetical protein
MRRSRSITLVLLTTTLFLGCEDKVRNQYASWDDCVKDYRDPSKCVEEKRETTSGYARVYYGPWYRPSQSGDIHRNPSAATKRSIGVMRGGWGSTGAHASS